MRRQRVKEVHVKYVRLIEMLHEVRLWELTNGWGDGIYGFGVTRNVARPRDGLKNKGADIAKR